MSDRKKHSPFIIIGLVVAVLIGIRLVGSIRIPKAAPARIKANQSELATDPRVVWQYHDEPLIEKSLLGGFMVMRPGLIVLENKTLYFSADKLGAFEPKTGETKWLVKPAPMAPLCIAGKNVLTLMGDKVLKALASTDGTVLWSAEIPAGVFCWLKVYGTTVLACLESGQQSQVFAFDLRSGRPLWQSPPASLTPRLSEDGKVYMADLRGRTVTALDGRTGQALWTFNSPEKLYDVSLGGSLLLTESVKMLHVFDRGTGRLKWKRPIAGNGFIYPNEGMLVMALQRRELTALDPKTGQQVWRQDLPTQSSETTVCSGKVYATTGKGVWGLDESSGKVLWKSTLANWTTGPIQVEGGVLYVLANGLYALDANSGVLLWEFTPGPQLSKLVISDGIAYVSDQDGSVLYAVRTGND